MNIENDFITNELVTKDGKRQVPFLINSETIIRTNKNFYMNIVIKATKYELNEETRAILEKKLAAPLKLLGDDSDKALLEIDVEEAPPEGRSSEPFRVVARLIINGKVFHAEAVKPSPESAADRVRSELEAELRKDRGRTRRLFKKGGAMIKNMLRFGR